MGFPKLDQYKKAKDYQFPDKEGTNPLNKGKDYMIETVKAMYSQHALGRTGISTAIHGKFEENRSYGREEQDDRIYRKAWTSGSKDASNEGYGDLSDNRTGVNNLDYRIVSVAGRIKDSVYGLFEQNEWNVSATAVDSVSGAEMESMKWRLWVESKHAETLRAWREQAQIPEPSFKFIPNTIEELDLYESNGGFKLNFMKSMEKLLKHTLRVSDWDESKYKYLDDALEIGWVGSRDYVDSDGIVKTRWLDLANTLSQYSRHSDFRDSEFAAEVVLRPMTELIEKGFDRKQLEAAARLYHDEYGNRGTHQFGRTDMPGDYLDESNYKHFMVPVLEAEWFDYDCKYYRTYENSFGKKRIEVTEFGADGEGIKVLRERVKYECKWVIDTDMVYEYGRSLVQNDNLSFHIVRVSTKPIIEKIIPFLDELMFAWLDYQRGVTLSNDPILAVNARLLTNITLDDKEATPEQIFGYMEKTNRLLYNDTMDGEYRGGDVRPMHLIESPIMMKLSASTQRFITALNNIQQVTGIAFPQLDNAQPPDGIKGQTEMSLVVSQNALKPIFSGVMKLKGQMSQSIMDQIGYLLQNSEQARQAYSKIIDNDEVELIRQAGVNGAKYGIDFIPRPDNEARQRILAHINNAMQPGRDGDRSIEISDAIMLEAMVMEGENLRQIGQIVGYQIEQYKERRAQQAAEAQERDAQKSMQLEQYKREMEQANAQAEFERKAVLSNNEIEGKLSEERMRQEGEDRRMLWNLEQEQQSDKMDMRQQQNNIYGKENDNTRSNDSK